MSDKTIKQLPTEFTTLQPDDWFIAQRDSDSETGKVRASNTFGGGWNPLSAAPNTVTHNGNRSYDLVFNTLDITGIVSPGMRLKLVRTSTPPTQCTDLESGSTQYYQKTSPSGLSFTTTFTCSAWIKVESYGSEAGIIARRNADTEGWSLTLNSDGRVLLTGLRVASNNKSIASLQSVPLNKWVHVAATMDMAAGDTSAQKIWIDGIEVPRSYSLVGTASALVQGTTALVVGSTRSSGSATFDGKIAQAAVFSTQLSDATVKAMMNQTLTGSETGLVSAFSLSNSLTDLSANANNLSAVNSAVATNSDSPFKATEYAIIMAAAFSTNTTLTVQVPEGYALPTTGNISSASYSTQKIPYGFPAQEHKWYLTVDFRVDTSNLGGITSGSFVNTARTISVPVGEWVTDSAMPSQVTASSTFLIGYSAMSTSTSALSDPALVGLCAKVNPLSDVAGSAIIREPLSLTVATTYYWLIGSFGSNATASYALGTSSLRAYMRVKNAYI